MKLDRPKRGLPALNLSPLIDVIFILLIFVVLVARFVDQDRMDVTVPSAEAGRPAQVDALMITVSQAGEVMIEDRLVSREELPEELKKARSRFGRAVLVADEDVPLQVAVDVISAAKLQGFGGVAVATRQPE